MIEMSYNGFAVRYPDGSLQGWYRHLEQAKLALREVKWDPTEFAMSWFRIGTVHNWQNGVQQALAILSEEFKSLTIS